MKFVLNEQEIQSICFQYIVDKYGTENKLYAGVTELTYEDLDEAGIREITIEIELKAD